MKTVKFLCVLAFLTLFMQVVASAQVTNLRSYNDKNYPYAPGDTLSFNSIVSTKVAKTDSFKFFIPDAKQASITIPFLSVVDTNIVLLRHSADNVYWSSAIAETLASTKNWMQEVTNLNLYPYLLITVTAAGIDTTRYISPIVKVSKQ